MSYERSKTSITVIFALLLGIAVFLFVPVVAGDGSDSFSNYVRAADDDSGGEEGEDKWGASTKFSAGIFGPDLSTPCRYIRSVYNFSMEIVGIITLVVILIGGIIYVFSIGKPETIQKAKEIITGAITGLILALTSWLLFNTVAPYLTICKDVEPVGFDTGPADAGYNPCEGIPEDQMHDTKEECEADPENECSEETPCVQEVLDQGDNDEEADNDDDSYGDNDDATDDDTGDDDDDTAASLIESVKAQTDDDTGDNDTGDNDTGDNDIGDNDDVEEEGRWCCKGGCHNVSFYSQGAEPWRNEIYECCNPYYKSACGPTAVAMALKDLGHSVDPYDVGQYFSSQGWKPKQGTAHHAIAAGPGHWGESSQETNWSSAKNSLTMGKLVVTLCKGPSKKPGSTGHFTQGGHFVLFTCFDEGTKTVSVSDPNGGKVSSASEQVVLSDCVKWWLIE